MTGLQGLDRDERQLVMDTVVKEPYGFLEAQKKLDFVDVEVRATRRSRTGDLLITNQLLYRLS